MKPVFRANGHEKRGFEWSTFSLKLKCFYSKVGGYAPEYVGINRFLEKITSSKLDGTYIKLLNQIEKTHLLILDDFGISPLDAVTRLALLQILEDRYGKKSVIIASQIPTSKWYGYIGESTIADAIMDRLAVNAHRIDLKGESLRKKI